MDDFLQAMGAVFIFCLIVAILAVGFKFILDIDTTNNIVNDLARGKKGVLCVGR